MGIQQAHKDAGGYNRTLKPDISNIRRGSQGNDLNLVIDLGPACDNANSLDNHISISSSKKRAGVVERLVFLRDTMSTEIKM